MREEKGFQSRNRCRLQNGAKLESWRPKGKRKIKTKSTTRQGRAEQLHAAAALSNHIQAPGLCPPARAVRISRTTYIPVCSAFATPHETNSSNCGRLFDDFEIAVANSSLANRCQTVRHKIWRLWRMASVFDKDVACTHETPWHDPLLGPQASRS